MRNHPVIDRRGANLPRQSLLFRQATIAKQMFAAFASYGVRSSLDLS
jgi:hypothetical protein